MTDYRNGKIHIWNGGECPVHPEDEVGVWFREGGLEKDRSAVFIWRNYQGDGDIIAFQVTKKHEEPLTIWVNIQPRGSMTAHRSKEAAERAAQLTGTAHIAVKFQEVKE